MTYRFVLADQLTTAYNRIALIYERIFRGGRKPMIGVSIESILQQVVQLPLSERQLLKQLLNDRNSPAAFSLEPELSLTQAAELLNVSVSFVERLLACSELQSAAATGQQTIKLADLLAYKKRSDEEAAAILDELTAQAQELKMGYE